MEIPVGNLLRIASDTTDREHIHSLLVNDALRIEQIVSYGHPSPAGFWYDQPDPEWVMLVQGSATLAFDGEGAVNLKAGDYLLIPAHRRHRVESVSADALWLAVHFRQPKVTF
ncbi:Cupin 2 conserved barrel domain protein [Chthoniobacter flavus Ellin428]|uniref:Cupin 2 conserved barrel domain protein n=1 Tax=Chthoniobacter flavus Ellin428 TaxID=497964 RepID=B4CX30_9BACT|nr:cupin domain-containing protein [Chthoniobacter flavus]EDY21350.1 Cupin 2 conserved barrel domain protein [Chthoniobacter flavus Ellin428]TCO84881.1 cupin 2 domain-containing protein [Chthoniobacter flavus]